VTERLFYNNFAILLYFIKEIKVLNLKKYSATNMQNVIMWSCDKQVLEVKLSTD